MSFIKKDATVFERTKAVYLFTVKHNIPGQNTEKSRRISGRRRLLHWKKNIAKYMNQ